MKLKRLIASLAAASLGLGGCATVETPPAGAIPGPAQNLQLDASRRDSAAQDMEKMLLTLKGMQSQAGIFID